ncbi:M81 family metallopeptidase [Kineococcus rhizosphaerae]|uniref:Microcystin degradation protein MlrC n=1 Tax=Kineococcus rhizosphaerae TaxID=559628 RepID=A0A2T0QX14_9ACTN|nr:M81 family metallopeptidase [Kineococcus rhizosphaerae]PRY10262.1 microcystin degradation protein MlrC [Kineococcus rhizosphaerae]
MRIAIGGIALEASTFCPHRTTLAEFHVVRGDELLARYDWLRDDWAADVEWIPLVHAYATPGGPALPEAYDALEAELLDGLAGPFDGVLLDVHGAMSVVGREDVEGALARRVRGVVGARTLVSASTDLHGNVSRDLAEAVDLVTCYRTAPHEDEAETRRRAARNLVARLRHGGRPLKAWVQVPVLLPGERTSTRVDPARRIYAQVPGAEALDGVLDAAVWVGYAWADEPRCRAAVVVTGDDADVIVREAGRLARSYWDAREEFALAAPAGTLTEVLHEALDSPARPFYVSDSGDNPTAGGAGDSSFALRTLLADERLRASGASVVLAAIADPVAARVCGAAGVGAQVSLDLGGHVDACADPLAVTGTVTALDAGNAVVRIANVSVVVTDRRTPFHHEADFTALGLDVRDGTDVVVVKIGYLEPELFAMAADWRLALTPGGVDQDLLRLGHRNLGGPVFPFAQPAPPDLTPEVVA